MRSESTRRLTQPRTVLTWWSRPRLRPDPHLRTAPSAVLPGNRGSSSPPRRGVQWTMPDCFCVPDAGARCSSARAATGASSTAGHVAAAPLGVNRCARRDAGISTLDAAGTVTPSASAATRADEATAVAHGRCRAIRSPFDAREPRSRKTSWTSSGDTGRSLNACPRENEHRAPWRRSNSWTLRAGDVPPKPSTKGCGRSTS